MTSFNVHNLDDRALRITINVPQTCVIHTWIGLKSGRRDQHSLPIAQHLIGTIGYLRFWPCYYLHVHDTPGLGNKQ